MLTLNTNLSSLIAQSSLNTSTNKLNQSIERMTTGFKVNHASDNAANYSISTNMTTKIGGYMVAEDNAAMGLDLVSTAEGILDQIQDKLERLRALQEQATNGTYGEDSLNAINKEASAIVDEINRLYNTAEYNGIKLFNSKTEDTTPAPGDTPAEPEYIGNFSEKIARVNTSSMTSLSSVSSSTKITSGTYKISTAAELKQLADMTNNGLIKGGEFVLANDIDLSGYSDWVGIGDYNNQSSTFSATFNGNGYVISNLKSSSGLFGNISDATIKNVGIENAVISGSDCAGILAAAAYCNESGGISRTEISNCYTTGSVTASSNGMAGGLVGAIANSVVNISDSYSEANVLAANAHSAGGLVGQCYYSGTAGISNCFSTGNVSAKYAGGLLGAGILYENDADMGTTSIRNSFSTGKVSGTDSAGAFAGGVEGYDGCISGCYYNSENNAGLDDIGVAYVNGLTATLSGMEGKTMTELLAMIPDFDARTNGGNGTTGGTSDYEPLGDIEFQIGIDSSISSRLGINTSFELKGVDKLRSIGLNTTADYLSQIDNILASVSDKQTEFGAVSNRLESVLDSIATAYDNLVSSRSTLRDADIAEVSAVYIQQQILQQASATLLSTANQSPAIALQLI